MKAKAKIEILVELECSRQGVEEDSLEAAKNEIRKLMEKLRKIAVQVRCTSLSVEADAVGLADLDQ